MNTFVRVISINIYVSPIIINVFAKHNRNVINTIEADTNVYVKAILFNVNHIITRFVVVNPGINNVISLSINVLVFKEKIVRVNSINVFVIKMIIVC